ncbi:uncharacterized protein [Dermacentor andersoni]|uniref:uncharacterized protein n=1 Tax=Dermacentor andersoni TaxID=34620 RepID=UPI002154FFE2|nr:uncharacterized protein LOC126535808 [Dermacentor andersoni]
MALLRTCCCWFSLRRGSFACGIYTLIFYTMLVATGASHLSSTFHSTVGFTLILLLLILSSFCIVFSVVLLLGLFFDNRLLLLPWLAFVSMTTVLDVALSLYFITDLKVDDFVIAMYVVDYTLCSINIYGIMCVVSQYQVYYVRGHVTEQISRRAPLPLVTTQNRDDGADQSGGRPALGCISSWYMRWLSPKTVLSRSADTVLPCRVIVPADTSFSADVAAAATALAATGRDADEATRNGRSNVLALEYPLARGRDADELSTGRQLFTEETSLVPYIEQSVVPPPSCEGLEDLSVELELQREAVSAIKGLRDHDGGRLSVGSVPDSQPLLDARDSLGICYHRDGPVCDRA